MMKPDTRQGFERWFEQTQGFPVGDREKDYRDSRITCGDGYEHPYVNGAWAAWKDLYQKVVW